MPKKTFFNLTEEKQNKILNAAAIEFSSKPFGKTSIDRIVNNAEIPKGSFYQYFEDKKDLYLYLLKCEMERLEEIIFAGASNFMDVISVLDIKEDMVGKIGERSYLLITSLNKASEYIKREWICNFVVPYCMKYYKKIIRDEKIESKEGIYEDFNSYIFSYLVYLTYEYTVYKDLSPDKAKAYYDDIENIVLKGLKLQSSSKVSDYNPVE